MNNSSNVPTPQSRTFQQHYQRNKHTKEQQSVDVFKMPTTAVPSEKKKEVSENNLFASRAPSSGSLNRNPMTNKGITRPAPLHNTRGEG